MRQILFFIITFALAIPCNSQDYFNKKENQNRKHLVIIHPTELILNQYKYLIDNKILDPGKNKIVGVYFEDEYYDYEKIISMFPEFGFYKVNKKIDPEEIYQSNAASSEFEKIFNYSNGIIFNGGPDIPPQCYNEETSLLTEITDPHRHYFEVSFLFHLIGRENISDFTPLLKSRPKYMVVGFCLGMQSMNVAAGGTLFQDIPVEIYHQNSIENITSCSPDSIHRNYYNDFSLNPDYYYAALHKIQITSGRWLDNNIKYSNPEPVVYSSHHQSIEDLGDNYRVIATSMDKNIIEGIEHMKFPHVIGLQFHPEKYHLYSDEALYKFSPDDEIQSLTTRLNESNSYDFHIELWKEISKMLR